MKNILKMEEEAYKKFKSNYMARYRHIISIYRHKNRYFRVLSKQQVFVYTDFMGGDTITFNFCLD